MKYTLILDSISEFEEKQHKQHFDKITYLWTKNKKQPKIQKIDSFKNIISYILKDFNFEKENKNIKKIYIILNQNNIILIEHLDGIRKSKELLYKKQYRLKQK